MISSPNKPVPDMVRVLGEAFNELEREDLKYIDCSSAKNRAHSSIFKFKFRKETADDDVEAALVNK